VLLAITAHQASPDAAGFACRIIFPPPRGLGTSGGDYAKLNGLSSFSLPMIMIW
jgi:hypothetical protein